MDSRLDLRLWEGRLLIAIVVAWNLQAALAFLLAPQEFAPQFELNGASGSVVVRGMAILFVMWNIPYLAAIWQPRRNRTSAWEAMVMQSIGVLGESFLLLTLPAGHTSISAALLRFIAFDAAGAAALIGAILLTHL
jgi:hypothetical protein